MPKTDYQDQFETAFLAPRYWATWLLFGLLWLVVQLPFRAQMAIGHGLGITLMLLSGRYRRVAQKNIRLCFPQYTPAQQAQLVRAHFSALGKGIIELCLCWWGRERLLRSLIEVEGQEHFDRARADGRGIILLSGHFTTIELSGRFLHQLHPIIATYKSPKNRVADYLLLKNRRRVMGGAIAAADVRGMLKALKQGAALAYFPDQRYVEKNRVFAPFFGIHTATNPATSRYAAIGNALTLPFSLIRKRDGRGYRLKFYPVLEAFPSTDNLADATRINQLLETMIADAPEQYFWVHDRFALTQDPATHEARTETS